MAPDGGIGDRTIGTDVSEWRRADIDAAGERLFVVGDVHGCAGHLAAWLRACAALRSEPHARERLVFLGDIINRGPDTPGAVAIWSGPSPVPGIARVHRLMGNHEQMLCLSDPPPDPVWRDLEPAVCVGNLVFVHAGVDPRTDLDTFLALSASRVPENHRHWAWIDREFLEWRGGFGRRVIVHGHTPPDKYRLWSGEEDPYVLRHGRLCLDGGSAITGVVAGAQMEDGRYRIIRATF